MHMTCAVVGEGVQWPDVGNDAIPCCHGSALFGHERCTCWTPIYDLEQRPVVEAEPDMRPEKCVDCAYRANSPERSGDGSADQTFDDLRNLAVSGAVFWCHQGMRRPQVWVHPYGAQIPGSPLNYQPPMLEQNGQVVPYKADGTPADMCGGWAALRLHHLWQEGKEA